MKYKRSQLPGNDSEIGTGLSNISMTLLSMPADREVNVPRKKMEKLRKEFAQFK